MKFWVNILNGVEEIHMCTFLMGFREFELGGLEVNFFPFGEPFVDGLPAGRRVLECLVLVADVDLFC